MDMTPVVNLSRADEFCWRMLAAETMFHSRALAKIVESSEIRFEEPVNICEIYVLSPSMYLRTYNGGFLLGGTEPKKFPITFHCNNADQDCFSQCEIGYGQKDCVSKIFSIIHCCL